MANAVRRALLIGESIDPKGPDAPGMIVLGPRLVPGVGVLTRSGRWVVLHGVPLAALDSQRVAVIVEPAHPSRIVPLLMSAYGLTDREQQLTRLILQGFSTIEIADRLVNLCTPCRCI